MNVDLIRGAIDDAPPLDVFGVKEISKVLQISERTLHDWRKSQNPPPLYRVGGSNRGTIGASTVELYRYLRKRAMT